MILFDIPKIKYLKNSPVIELTRINQKLSLAIFIKFISGTKPSQDIFMKPEKENV
jgi:hypothetical protein